MERETSNIRHPQKVPKSYPRPRTLHRTADGTHYSTTADEGAAGQNDQWRKVTQSGGKAWDPRQNIADKRLMGDGLQNEAISRDVKTGPLLPHLQGRPPCQPENYRPVCLLSHARKMVDTVFLDRIYGKFTPAPCQVGFQYGVPIAQDKLRANYIAGRGLTRAVILSLEKAYDTVNRTTLIQFSKEWLDGNLLSMLRATLTHICVQRKKTIGLAMWLQ